MLEGAYIFDDTIIGAGSRVEASIIGSEVRIGSGSIVRSGCVIGNGVVLGENARLAKFERVSRRRDLSGEEADDEDDDDEWEMVEAREWTDPFRVKQHLTRSRPGERHLIAWRRHECRRLAAETSGRGRR